MEDDEEDWPVELAADDALEFCELMIELVAEDRELEDEDTAHELTGDTMTCSSNGKHAMPASGTSSKMFGALQLQAPKW